MRRLSSFALPLIAITVAACGGGTSTSSPSIAPTPTPTAAGSTRIEVQLTDEFRISPDEINVPLGEPVTFVITNVGAIEHEFFVGTEEEQAEHEAEMASGGMAHDEPMGVSVAAGATKELTITFTDPETLLAGCHETGHYGAGMKATIRVGS